MKNNFQYNIQIEETLKVEDAVIILKFLKAHPDTRKFTESGHFGFSFENYYKDQNVSRCWTIKELDIMLKALEVPVQMVNDQLTGEDVKRLRKMFYSWHKAIIHEYSRITNN